MVFPWCTLSLESLIVPQVAFKQVLTFTHGPVPFFLFRACDSGLWSDLRPRVKQTSGFKQAQQQNWSLQSTCPDEHLAPRLQSPHIPELSCHLLAATSAASNEAPTRVICTMMNPVTLMFCTPEKTNKPTLLIPNLLVKAFGITEWMGLEGTLKTIESQPFEDVQG